MSTGKRALCVGVGSFTEVERSSDVEPDLPRFPQLSYAARYTDELRSSLLEAGYEATGLADPTAGDLGARVVAHLEGDGIALVHVLTHGELRPSGQVYAIGSDGRHHRDTNLTSWCQMVTDSDCAPLTLFLLDLCHAGVPTANWQPPEPEHGERAWVIAATGATGSAYAGRLTRAVTNVVHQITNGEADLDESVRYVGFDDLHRMIAAEVLHLARAEHGFDQIVRCTPTEGVTPELPFFTNPRYREPGGVRALADQVESASAPFLDPVIDAPHFRTRASGHDRSAGLVDGSAFSGRGPQLRQLTAFLDAVDTADGSPTGAGLLLVRGSPGSGKSALLGLCVCAAHPQMRVPTTSLWQVAAYRPALNRHMAAVHARQRGLSEIVASLTRQLAETIAPSGTDPAPPGDTDSDGTSTEGEREVVDLPDATYATDDLIGAIEASPVRPVVVLDALDEALRPSSLVEDLLLPLARATRPDGQTACRLVVGTRPWSEFDDLLSHADNHGEVLDLDEVPADQRHRDIETYVDALLELRADRAGTESVGARRIFAAAVADTLTRPDQREREAGVSRPVGSPAADRQWGEFLVAALYTHMVAEHRPAFLADAGAAARAGRRAPTTLPEVLELDLELRPSSPWRPATRAALARGRGQGMSRTVLHAVVRAIVAQQAAADEFDVEDELQELRFFLRTSVDEDGSVLYRFFHQSLADHLGGRPDGTTHDGVDDRILDALLAMVPSERGARRWDLAPRYVARHAIEHAPLGRIDELLVDAGFLVHADPVTLVPALAGALSADARLAAAVYRASAARHPSLTARQRRDVLVVDAARHDARDLALRLAVTPPPARWRPRWASGRQVSTALRATVVDDARGVRSMLSTEVDGRAVLITVSGQRVRVRDLATMTSSELVLPALERTSVGGALVCVDLEGRSVLVGTAATGLQLWDLASGTPWATLSEGSYRQVEALDCINWEDRRLAVLTRRWGDRPLEVWDLVNRRLVAWSADDWRRGSATVACAVVAGRPVAVTGGYLSRTNLTVWDMLTAEPIGDIADGHNGDVLAVLCAEIDGRPMAVTAGADATIRRWDLSRRCAVGGPLVGHEGRVHALARFDLDGRPSLVSGGDDATVRAWDLSTGTPLGAPLTGHGAAVTAVVCSLVAGRPIAVTLDGQGEIRVWDLLSIPTAASGGHTGALTSAACTERQGAPVVVTGGADGAVRLWDLRSGRSIGDPMVGHAGTVSAIDCTSSRGRPLAVTGSNHHRHGDVRIWDLDATTGIGGSVDTRADADADPDRTHQVTAVTCAHVDGSPVALSAGAGHGVQLWQLDSPSPVGQPLHEGDPRPGAPVTSGTLHGRPVALTQGPDTSTEPRFSTVLLWDLQTRALIGNPLTSERIVWSTFTELDGRTVVVSGHRGGFAVWDPVGRNLLGAPFTERLGSSVVAATYRGRTLLLTNAPGSCVSVWDLRERKVVLRIEMPSAVGAISLHRDGVLVVGTGWDVVVIELLELE